MTAPLDLDALDSLLAKATPGPWQRSSGWTPREQVVDHENIYGRGAGVVVKVVRAAQDGNYSEERDANATLVVRLVNTAPALVSELRAAREALADAVTAMDPDIPSTPAFKRDVLAKATTLSRAATGGAS